MYSTVLANISRAGHAGQHCRDNVDIFSVHDIVGFCIMSFFVMATPLDTETLTFFVYFLLLLKLYYVVELSLSRSYKNF